LAGRLEEALASYDLAIELNPHYEKAKLNRAMALDKIGQWKGSPKGLGGESKD